MIRHCQGERGSITGFVAVVATALVMVAGMAYDGGEIIAAQARARSDADKAARAGAQQVDTVHLRATGQTTLDPSAAEAAAHGFLQQAGSTGTVAVEGASVTVTVSITQPMRILPVPDRVVVVSETATAVDEVSP
jgi:hypothetical protein